MKKITDFIDRTKSAKGNDPFILLQCTQNDPYLLTQKTFINGESTVVLRAKSDHKRNVKFIGRAKGEKLTQIGLKTRQVSQVRRICRMLYYTAIKQRKKLYFVTLTFKNYPTDTEAKKMLTRLLKSLRKKIGRSYHYLWMAEKDRRDCIHFHLVFMHNFDKEKVLIPRWKNLVNEWEKKQGYKVSDYVHLQSKPVWDVRVLSKYLTKNINAVGHEKQTDKERERLGVFNGRLWGCAAITKQLLKAETITITDKDYKYLDSIYLEMANQYCDRPLFEHYFKEFFGKLLYIPSS